MTVPAKSNLQSYHVILYSRALHPELFPLRGRRVFKHGAYELEAWIMAGAHLLRFEHHNLCASELVTDQDTQVPQSGQVSAFLAAGEHEFEHQFPRERVVYMTSVQSEQLSENLYLATYDEMLALARLNDAVHLRWEDEAGRCLSVVDVQKYSKEVHAQCYHLVASGGVVLRTQTIFEHE